MFGAALFVSDDDEIEQGVEIARDGLGAFYFTLDAIWNQVFFQLVTLFLGCSVQS